MRLLLIQQQSNRKSDPYPIVFPIGLAYLAANLINHDVRIIDLNLIENDLVAEYLRNAVSAFEPEIIGISIRNIDTTVRVDPFIYCNDIQQITSDIRKYCPKATIVIGGTGFSLFPYEIMNVLSADIGVYLEGEETFRELVDKYTSAESVKGLFIRKSSRVIYTGYRKAPDFNRLPEPVRDLPIIGFNKYVGRGYHTIGVQTKRGCIHSCAYCSYPKLNGHILRLRDPKNVVDEIERMSKGYGVKKFTFADNIFNMPEVHAIEIASEMIKRKMKIEWSAWFDIKQATERLLDIAEESGCRLIEVSPDAADRSGLYELNKNLDPRDIRKFIKKTMKHRNIIIMYNFFVSYPGQTPIGILKILLITFRILCRSMFKDIVHWNWIRILPNTHIQAAAVSAGIIKQGQSLFPKNVEELKKMYYVAAKTRFCDACLFCLCYVYYHLKRTVNKCQDFRS